MPLSLFLEFAIFILDGRGGGMSKVCIIFTGGLSKVMKKGGVGVKKSCKSDGDFYERTLIMPIYDV